jgi:hypothetical protein
VKNLIQKDEVFVYNYNGVAGDSFKVYYVGQAADQILQQTTYWADGAVHVLASPVAGLTNQQNWDIYGIALAGELAPETATTRQGIAGLIAPI